MAQADRQQCETAWQRVWPFEVVLRSFAECFLFFRVFRFFLFFRPQLEYRAKRAPWQAYIDRTVFKQK